MGIYKQLVRPVLFRCDAEAMHNASVAFSRAVGWLPPARGAMAWMTRVENPRLHSNVAGLAFPNPIGLAAGYDKSGVAIDTWAALGFGHVEVGSISIDPSQGNPKPRLFRLPDDQAVVVHYGLQNDGVVAIAPRFRSRRTTVPVGANIVKTNRGICAPPEQEEAILQEYIDAVRLMAPVADYLTLNLSCPNTETGRDFFQESGHVRRLMAALREVSIDVPLFLKVSPLGGAAAIDCLLEQVDGVAFVSGFIFNLAPGINGPLKTPAEQTQAMRGTLAGRPVEEQMNACIGELYRRMDRSRYTIIGAGGVFTSEDAYRKIQLGASLVQLLTGMVYQGPMVVRRICRGLVELLERDGFPSVAEAVGTAEKQ